jgi:adenosine deaminase
VRLRAILLALFLCSICGLSWCKEKPSSNSTPEARTARYLDSVRDQPSLLLEFLRELPKGGDLHNHLVGAIYAEDFIRWAAADGLCVDRRTSTFQVCNSDENQAQAKDILTDAALYQQVINALSMRAFNGPESGHDHFFNTFGKFGAVAHDHLGDMLAAAASQAAADHLSYLELLLGPDRGAADRIVTDNKIAFDENLPSLREKLINAGLVNAAVSAAKKDLDEGEARKNELLQCDTPQAQPGCKVAIHYQYQVLRGLPPATVFSEMLAACEIAKADPRVVDLNPVMPEDAYVPMHDFDLHMRMIGYLRTLYPQVHLSLHAGELWTGLVPPHGLTYHIRSSVEVAHAQRIGHGVDVMFENDPVGLLREMANRKVAVEINLSSNDQILGVRGNQHPLPMYLQYGVPVVLSTDDQGVARSDATQEYVRAVRDYHLSYPVLKQIVRNSLEFSFLPGESLWTDSTYKRRNPACTADPATAQPKDNCADFLKRSERAHLQWQLEADLHHFETKSCCTADTTTRPQPGGSMR